MSWNLFERIINALRPGRESEQPSDTSQSRPQESEQPADTWPEGRTQSPEASQEPSPDFQEVANPAQPNQGQD